MNKIDWQLFGGGFLFLAAIIFSAWSAVWSGINKPIPIDLYLISYAVAFVGYFWTIGWLKLSLKQTNANQIPTFLPTTARLLLLIAIAARLIVLPAPHRFNSDVSRYVWDGYLVTQGFNPYQFAPSDDELKPLQSNFRFNRLNPEFNQIKTVYGPVATAVFVVANSIDGNPEFNIRMLMVFGDLLAIFIITMALRRMGKPEIWVLIYAINPLMVDSFAERGQMEGVLMPILAAILLSLATKRFTLAGVLIALAVAAKIHMLLLFPIAIATIARLGNKRWVRVLVGFSVSFLLCSTPYWLAGPESLSGVIKFGSSWQANNSFFSMFKYLLDDQIARSLAALAFAIAYSLIITTCLRSHETSVVIFSSSVTSTFFMLLLFSPAVFPWYLVWGLPMLPIVASHSKSKQTKHYGVPSIYMAWSASVILWYLKFIVYDEMEPHFLSIKNSVDYLSNYIDEPWRLFEYGALLVILFTGIAINIWKRR